MNLRTRGLRTRSPTAEKSPERTLNHYLMAQSVLRAQVMLGTAAPRLSFAASCGCPADGVRHALCPPCTRRACVVRLFNGTRPQQRMISARPGLQISWPWFVRRNSALSRDETEFNGDRTRYSHFQ